MLALAIVLLVVWALGFLVFKVAAFVIHLFLIVGLIALVMHVVRRPRTPV